MKFSFNKRLRSENPRIRYRTMMLLAFVAATLQAAEPERDLATLLDTQSCDRAWTDAGFILDVLNRSFPVPRGFRFVGVERNLVVFRRKPIVTGEIIGRSHNDGDASLQEKSLALNGQRASIAYGEKRDIVLSDTGVSREVTALPWDGLDIFFWTSEGGNIVNTKTYQAVVQVQDNDYQMAITTFDQGLISSIIGCSG